MPPNPPDHGPTSTASNRTSGALPTRNVPWTLARDCSAGAGTAGAAAVGAGALLMTATAAPGISGRPATTTSLPGAISSMFNVPLMTTRCGRLRLVPAAVNGTCR